MRCPTPIERTWMLIQLHGPVVRVVLGALSSLALLVGLHSTDLRNASVPASVLAILAGAFYTQLFEYAYHRLLMHGRWIRFITRRHLQHHRIFHGENFASRRIEDLQHVAGPWFLFPAILLAHYLMVRLVLAPELVVAFLAGCVLHYLAFELSHWFAHVEGNLFDRSLQRVPVVGELRRQQLIHHRVHHELPDRNFNFIPPYAGDHLGSRAAELRGAARAEGISESLRSIDAENAGIVGSSGR